MAIEELTISMLPPLRHARLDQEQLHRFARAFDEIGDEIGGARYPATAFVKWLADEHAASGRRPSRGEQGGGTQEVPISGR